MEKRMVREWYIRKLLGLRIEICRWVEKDFVVGIKCDCAPGTKQDYCLNIKSL